MKFFSIVWIDEISSVIFFSPASIVLRKSIDLLVYVSLFSIKDFTIMKLNKVKIAGILLFIIGCSSYFFVEGEPYTTITGICAGIGFGMFLIGSALATNVRRG
ncbi:hypothetical protein LZ575_03245 [Antarcticibacterium sp. 1MA-6-2]|uniref:hypothetical protein n=1 Tax=Antarcticibacterium sp. 1MA-6-2 TaxID=2908210 RepID=UPI001F2D1339|nr:hypothetical protein [Antarcticibacterium sp. 1MA-6-2]UJH91715.1 hypothetical protein LZ575_03245 [Antarcticibacterium sp. 1MA-6-2]